MALISTPVLVTPNFSKQFFIQCDASSTGVGAVLFQKDEEDQERPIAYMSQKLNAAQRNYTVTELECLSAVLAVKKFRSYVEGFEFTIITDHASLTWLMSQKDLSGRLARWSLKLQGFNFTIQYCKGSQNTVPDGLSRVNMDEIAGAQCLNNTATLPPAHIDFTAELDAFQSPEYLKLVLDIQNSPTRGNFDVKNGRLYINLNPDGKYSPQDSVAWKLVVPQCLRARLVEMSHIPPTSAHLGIHKTIEVLQRLYFWPTLSSDVRNFISSCETCKQNKALNYTNRPPLSSLPLTFRPWQRVYLDFLGPYPRTRNGNTSILIALDHYSKFVLTYPVRQATAAEVVKFVEKNIFLMFGVPEVILTDNGRQFEAKIFRNLLEKYGVNQIFTAKYSPQANASERVNRTLLAALRSYITEDQRTWDTNLDAITQALRNVQHDSTRFSPHFIVFGQHIVLHGSAYELLKDSYQLAGNFPYLEQKPEDLYILQSKVQSHVLAARQKSHSRYDLRSRPRVLSIGQEVFIRNFTQSSATDNYAAKLAPKFVPARIKARSGNVAYEVQDHSGKSLGVFHLKDIRT